MKTHQKSDQSLIASCPCQLILLEEENSSSKSLVRGCSGVQGEHEASSPKGTVGCKLLSLHDEKTLNREEDELGLVRTGQTECAHIIPYMASRSAKNGKREIIEGFSLSQYICAPKLKGNIQLPVAVSSFPYSRRTFSGRVAGVCTFTN